MNGLLGLLGTRAEIEEPLCPFTRRSPLSPSQLLDRYAFAGVGKGYAPATFGKQEEEL